MTSTKGDTEITLDLQTVDLDKWRSEKWNKLPNAKNFHTSLGFEKCWEGIKVISDNDLPPSVLKLDIMKQFINKKEGQYV